MSTHYQAVVIGAGPGGYPCAIRLSQLGVKTLIIDKQYIGGVCLNVGCIPSKALINAAHTYEKLTHADEMGFTIDGDIGIDMSKIQRWKDGVVTKLTGGVGQLLKGNKVDVLMGEAKFSGANALTVTNADGEQTITADHIVVATGSTPVQIPGFAYADAPVLDSTKALSLTEVPKHMVIIGGGYIGLELGSLYAKLGANVTVVEMMKQVLPSFDKDVINALKRKLKKDGVKILLKTKALGWEQADNGIVVHVETPKGKESLEADNVLVTVGRRPNSKGLGLEDIGVNFDGPFISVDKQMKTNVPGVYAIGDVVGQPMLAHKATHEGELVAEVIHGKNVQFDAKAIPAVVFTDPEIAVVGLTENQCKEQGRAVKVGKVPFAAIGKAIANNATDGFTKVIIDADTKLILGVTIVGSHASDMISEASLAIEMCAEALDVGLTIHAHPTLGEAVMEAAKAALGEAIHIINR
ncbi:MAG: dihydrolipoyl dehydrogenase [Rhodobacterales bacterium]|nr:dihydrolipoyl dehydrogenase [Rhodobacterales bacterium]